MTTLNLFIGGQSFAEPLLTNLVCTNTMKQAFARQGVTLNIYGYAVGGSSILKANAHPSTPNNYWWNEGTNGPGPNLTAAVSYIGTLSPKPTRILWAQGEGDSVGPNPDPVAFKAGTIAVIAAIRTALGNNAGVVMQPVGRRLASGNVLGVQIIREAQLDMANASSPYVYGGDCYDLTLLGDDPMVTSDVGNSHFFGADFSVWAWRMSQRLLQSISPGASPPIYFRMPPSVGAITRSGNGILVPISVATGSIIKPTAPSGFAIRDAAGVIEADDMSLAWSGGTLIITPPRPFGAGHFLNPYGMLNALDREALIRDSLYRMPLRATKATIP